MSDTECVGCVAALFIERHGREIKAKRGKTFATHALEYGNEIHHAPTGALHIADIRLKGCNK